MTSSQFRPQVLGTPIQVRRQMSTRERFWLLAAVVIVPIVVFFQQFTLGLQSLTLSSAPREMLEIETPENPGFSDLAIRSKLAVWTKGGEDSEPAAEVLKSLEELAITRAERVRLALVAGELLGAEVAIKRLDALEKEAAPGGDLASEIAWFKRFYGEDRESVPQEVRSALIDRHGWFAQLALSHGLPDFDRDRRALTEGMGAFIGVVALTGLGSLAALIGGLVVVVITVIRWREGRIEMRLQEAIGGPVYLELFVIFAGGFALLLSAGLILFGMNAEGTAAAMAVQEVLLWCLVAALAWPMIRKLPWSRFAWDVGLHRGEGVAREVRAGFYGWLASMPILVVLGLLTTIITGGADEADPSGYPLFQSPKANSWLVVLLSMMSAVIWAPIIEEIVFRGALQRYLRPRLKWWGAILVTAAIFGLIHPYTTAGLVQVAVGGVLFGFLREWRGSLIAPITAHFLHNGSIVAFTLAFLAAMD